MVETDCYCYSQLPKGPNTVQDFVMGGKGIMDPVERAAKVPDVGQFTIGYLPSIGYLPHGDLW